MNMNAPMLRDLIDALRFADSCSEDVTRRGEAQPCEKEAVALRYDPTEGRPYAVCPRHARADMVPLSHIVELLPLSVLTRLFRAGL